MLYLPTTVEVYIKRPWLSGLISASPSSLPRHFAPPVTRGHGQGVGVCDMPYLHPLCLSGGQGLPDKSILWGRQVLSTTGKVYAINMPASPGLG